MQTQAREKLCHCGYPPRSCVPFFADVLPATSPRGQGGVHKERLVGVGRQAKWVRVQAGVPTGGAKRERDRQTERETKKEGIRQSKGS